MGSSVSEWQWYFSAKMAAQGEWLFEGLERQNGSSPCKSVKHTKLLFLTDSAPVDTKMLVSAPDGRQLGSATAIDATSIQESLEIQIQITIKWPRKP